MTNEEMVARLFCIFENDEKTSQLIDVLSISYPELLRAEEAGDLERLKDLLLLEVVEPHILDKILRELYMIDMIVGAIQQGDYDAY